MRRAGARAHVRALVLVGATFVAAAGMLGGAAAVTGVFASPRAATSFAVANAGYLLLALAMLQARVLVTLRRPGTAVTALIAGLGLTVAVAVAIRGLSGAFYPVVGLTIGAAATFVATALAVRIALRRPGHALLSA